MPSVRIAPDLRRVVAARAQHRCEYCKALARYHDLFTIDHVHPRSAGGETVAANLAYACVACNLHKRDKTSAMDGLTGKIARLFNPRMLAWSDHFTWAADGATILGITGTGRVTVETLHLNRIEAINLRMILVERGEHPPSD